MSIFWGFLVPSFWDIDRNLAKVNWDKHIFINAAKVGLKTSTLQVLWTSTSSTCCLLFSYSGEGVTKWHTHGGCTKGAHWWESGMSVGAAHSWGCLICWVFPVNKERVQQRCRGGSIGLVEGQLPQFQIHSQWNRKRAVNEKYQQSCFFSCSSTKKILRNLDPS